MPDQPNRDAAPGLEDRELREELHTKLIASVPDIFVHLDLQGTILEASGNGLKDTGYECGDLVGRNMMEFIAPEDRPKAMANTVAMLERYLGPQEYHLVTKPGGTLLFEVNGDVLRRPDGTPFGMVHVCRNITEREQARAALAESEERFRSVVENSHDGIIIVDDDYRLTYANEECTRIIGYTREELVGQDYRKFVTPETMGSVVTNYAMRQQGLDAPPRYELKIIRKDGSECWVENSSTTYRDAGGRIWTVSQLLDVNERKLAEQSLRESEARFRSVVENSHEGIIIIDDAFRLTYANDEMCRIAGVALEELLGHDFRQFVSRDTVDSVVNNYSMRVKGLAAPTRYELKIARKDGSERWVETSSSTYVDEQGRTWTVGQLLDIHERKLAEKSVRESEERFRSVVENSHEGIILIDDDYRLAYMNDEFCRIMAYSREELLGQDFRPFVTPDTLNRPVENYHRRRKGLPTSPRYEFRIIRKDGSERWVETSSAIFVDAQGHKRTVAQLLDIHERKLAEESLRESEEKYRLLAENVSDIIFIMDMQTLCYSYCSPSVQRITGYTSEEITGLPVWQVLAPESAQLVKRILAEEVAAEGSEADPQRYRTMELEQYKKAGGTVWTEVSARFVRDAEGRPVGVLGVTRDISERKELESKLQQAQKMEALGTLAGGVAHDFNNLLQAISGYSHMLLESGGLSPEDLERVRHIHRASARADTLVKQLLTFSRKIEPQLKAVDLAELTSDVLHLLERTIPKMITISCELEDGLWPVEGDASQIEQVFINLATNSRDAMPGGGHIVIEGRNQEVNGAAASGHLPLPPGDYVHLVFRDTGTGIPADLLPHVFDPFQTTKEVGKGTGLGLSMVFGVVKNHRGHIECSSAPGQGARFDIWLPVYRGGEGAPARAADHSLKAAGASAQGSILVVDDEDAIVELVSQYLVQMGFTVRTASTGEEALEIFQVRHPDINLVILDLGMPGMGGLNCLKAMREINPEAKVLIATGYFDDAKYDNGRALGADALIKKPYSLPSLMAEIGRLV